MIAGLHPRNCGGSKGTYCICATNEGDSMGDEQQEVTYLDHLKPLTEEDVQGLRKAEESYGDSWLKRGGVGAFMMLARKWDRIEKQVVRLPAGHYIDESMQKVEPTYPYDIFQHMRHSEPNGIIDDIKDLRRYLLLCEAEVRCHGYMTNLDTVIEADIVACQAIDEKWKQRDGIGLFFKLADKWDNLEDTMRLEPEWDILNHMRANPGIVEQVRWLRRYLLLCEAEARARLQREGESF
jgi:hypothetical protein